MRIPVGKTIGKYKFFKINGKLYVSLLKKVKENERWCMGCSFNIGRICKLKDTLEADGFNVRDSVSYFLCDEMQGKGPYIFKEVTEEGGF